MPSPRPHDMLPILVDHRRATARPLTGRKPRASALTDPVTDADANPRQPSPRRPTDDARESARKPTPTGHRDFARHYRHARAGSRWTTTSGRTAARSTTFGPCRRRDGLL